MKSAPNYLRSWGFAAALAAGCGAQPVHLEYVQAQPVMDASAPLPPPQPVVAVAGATLKPGEMPSRPQLPREALDLPAPARPSYEVIEAANRAAMQEPRADQYINAVQSWPFEAGATYKIYTAPMYVTDVALRPGEKIQGQIAAGDSVRWLTAVGTSVVNGLEQQHVYVKPTRPGLQTNVVIQTDQSRTYFVELFSFKTTHMLGVSWTYPREDFAAQLTQRNDVAQAAKQFTTLSTTNLAHLNCDYVIKVIAGNPRWKPRAVCDDGAKTVINFPSAMTHREAPVLLIQQGAHTSIGNYQPQNGSYLVPRLIDGAELRLGQDDGAEVVRIARRRR